MARLETIVKGWLGGRTEYILHLTANDVENISDASTPASALLTFIAALAAGIPGGAVALLCTAPVWMIKQVNKKHGKQGVRIKAYAGWMYSLNPLRFLKPLSQFEILPP